MRDDQRVRVGKGFAKQTRQRARDNRIDFIHGGVRLQQFIDEKLKSLLNHRVETAPDLGGKP